jgi:hypothetical protein
VPAEAAIDEQRQQHETRSESAAPEGGEYALPPRGNRPIEHHCVELCPICRTADVLRATLPEEFQDHWHAWQREMLMAARSLLDHYIERIESERRRAVQVEDIPIE